MNRKRCPWCGKIIDKEKDKIDWRDRISSPSVPRRLHMAKCGHCGHKYGQIAFSPYMFKLFLIIVLAFVLAFVFQFGPLLLLAVPLCFLSYLAPYYKLDDNGRACDKNTDLLCEIVIIEKYNDIKRDNFYFLNDCFDDFAPFVMASPINIYSAPKNSNVLLGEFLYINEKNYDYIKSDSCNFYDAEMNLVAKIRFVMNNDTI